MTEAQIEVHKCRMVFDSQLTFQLITCVFTQKRKTLITHVFYQLNSNKLLLCQLNYFVKH